MHPACIRILLCIFLITTDAFFLVVIVKVGNENTAERYLCKENRTISKENNQNGTCWAWNLGSQDETCMFSLLFAATICLHTAFLVVFVSAIVKCLFPEFVILAQRSVLLRCLSRYFTVALSFAACNLGSSLLIYISVNDSMTKSSCFKTGHLWWNCRKGRDSCYVYALLLTGCVCSLLLTFLSACDARLVYVTKKDIEEQEQIYKSYVDYQAIKDLDSY